VRRAPADQPLKTTAPGCRVRDRWRPVRAISPGRFRSMPLRARANYRGWRPTIHVGHSLDQHGKDVARIALPIAAMDRDQTGRRCVAGRIETNLGSFAIPVWNIQSGGAPCPQSRRSLVARGDQRRECMGLNRRDSDATRGLGDPMAFWPGQDRRTPQSSSRPEKARDPAAR
jgi:hypothetical protein